MPPPHIATQKYVNKDYLKISNEIIIILKDLKIR
jgi:hypothetical protein